MNETQSAAVSATALEGCLSDEALLSTLVATAGRYERHGLWWRKVGDDPALRMFVECSDFFAWGCSDVEALEDTTVPVFIESLADAEAATTQVTPGWDGPEGALLFCARNRQMRPQGAYYPYLHSATWPLFDAAGPARAIGLGDPVARPSMKAATGQAVGGAETKEAEATRSLPSMPEAGVALAATPPSIATIRRAFETCGFDYTEDLAWILDGDGALRIFAVSCFDTDERKDCYRTAEITDANIDRLVAAYAAAGLYEVGVVDAFVNGEHARP